MNAKSAIGPGHAVTCTPVSEKAKSRILRLLGNLPSRITLWCNEHKAIFLAGIRAGIDYAKQLRVELGITRKIMADWGTNLNIQAKREELCAET